LELPPLESSEKRVKRVQFETQYKGCAVARSWSKSGGQGRRTWSGKRAVEDVGLQGIEKFFPAATEEQVLEVVEMLNRRATYADKETVLRNRRLGMAFDIGSPDIGSPNSPGSIETGPPQLDQFHEWLCGEAKTPRC
jgi:hypothetical protein